MIILSPAPLKFFRRMYASSKAIMYSKYGEPHEVLHLVERALAPIKPDEVTVKMCAAPIHPSDINTVQGVYPVRGSLPAVGGNEGVGKVVECGSDVKSLKTGDFVMPAGLTAGTWQTYLTGKATEFLPVPRSLTVMDAAVFAVNPSTAYRMLLDFTELHPGDLLVQNGATSAVGIYVIQLTKLLGIRTANIFRPRQTKEETEKTRQVLLDYGATWALTEREFTDKSSEAADKIKKVGPAKLALNCLGGKPAMVLMKSLGRGGTLVSYGGMTRTPMPVPVGPLIFKDIRLCGFWISDWIMNHDASERQKMLDKLGNWFSTKSLRASPFEAVHIEDWQKAINMSMFTDSQPTGLKKKAVLVMD
ncbi:unnamed protein product [Calicophoron daubneyi]|uniref:Enoyl-[acyl-carrier-protein] reductase, mitochondrial n=1 Tax=Calicophoron daubneyi TaxID=300641 RepID=A0AAV2TCL0_CALDB